MNITRGLVLKIAFLSFTLSISKEQFLDHWYASQLVEQASCSEFVNSGLVRSRKRWVMSILFLCSWGHPCSSSVSILSTLPPIRKQRTEGRGTSGSSLSPSLCPGLGAGLCPVRAGGRLSSICPCPSPLSEEGIWGSCRGMEWRWTAS